MTVNYSIALEQQYGNIFIHSFIHLLNKAIKNVQQNVQ